MFLGVLFAAIFLFCGMLASYFVPRSSIYNRASDLKAMVEKAFVQGDVRLSVTGDKIVAGKGEQLGNSLVVDTVRFAEDKEKYAANGYNLVVDTRPVNEYDDFVAYCTTASGKEISYEEYLQLDSDTKAIYKFAIRYTGNAREIDQEWQERCRMFLDTATGDVARKYADVKKLSGDEYVSQLYELYVSAYYPDLSDYEKGGVAPKVRSYYTHYYEKQENILFVFDDSIVARFTSAGAKHVYYGFYVDMSSGDVAPDAKSVHTFFTQSFKGSKPILLYNCVMNFMMLLPYLVFIVIAIIFAVFCLGKLVKAQFTKFGQVSKLVCNYLFWTAVFTALFVFGLSFVVAQSTVFGMTCVVFSAALLARCVAYIIREGIISRRTRLEEQVALPETAQVENADAPAEQPAQIAEEQSGQQPAQQNETNTEDNV